jgi:hypothetical protein
MTKASFFFAVTALSLGLMSCQTQPEIQTDISTLEAAAAGGRLDPLPQVPQQGTKGHGPLWRNSDAVPPAPRQGYW